MKKRSVNIISLGCSKNLVDAEQLARQFEALGYNLEYNSENIDSEIVIVNTCGFMDAAKQESINTILAYARLRKSGKIGRLFVMGCLSERYLNELQAEIPEVDKYYGKFNYSDILTEIGQTYRADLKNERTLSTPSHYAYIKISEGCNRTCSYCAIPLITGRHRSRTMEDILEEIKRFVKNGTREFQLIAQDLSYYGLDRYKSQKLSELIQRIADIKGVDWIRLHYAYPANFPFDILPVIRHRQNVCNYLDLALQHISDKMLKLMRRNITKAETFDLLKRIREEVPDIHLRTTLLLGHPQETEDDVAELIDFVQEMRFERLGAFTFSNEESTYAFRNYADNISESEKLRRMGLVMDIQQLISEDINRSKRGKIFKTIIDKKQDNYFIGRTEYDSPEVDNEVLIPAEKQRLTIGEFYSVKITDNTEFDLYGAVT
ncbi:MAG: 30S ribosomal protein S12 methylthiotransferase RimO [Prevotellaceae bacterium]|nr:30S ribosomal protein S12 methylthiotransferase RimO [Prevotellaceae bacterium]